MSEHNDLIHKTYQALFVLYAPLAIISLLIKFFSGTVISFVFITAVLSSAVSIIIGVVMCIQFWRHRKAIKKDREVHIPYIIRHRFMIMYIPIAIASLLVTSYYIFDRYVKTVEFYGSGIYTKVSILLPIRNEIGLQIEDAQQVKLAVGSYLIDNPSVTSKYHFNIYDHNNTYSEELESEVVSQISSGTKYIVCAYSDVCSKLANNMDEILSKASYTQRPILITTLSSSMQLPLEKNKFYRFYVRNREDARALAKVAFEKGLKKASFIATSDAYGKDAAREFEEAWKDFGGEFVEGVYVDDAMTPNVVAAKVQQSEMVKAGTEAIFVAHYQSINEALKPLAENNMLLFSANYQQNFVQDLALSGIEKDKLIVSTPSFKIAHKKLRKTAGVFTYLTLMKLVNADEKAKGKLSNFHHYWQSEDQPSVLEFQKDGEDDFKVMMNAAPIGDDIHSSLNQFIQ